MKNSFIHIMQKTGSLLPKWKISLSAAPFLASILVIFSLTLFIGVFWMVNEYQAYRESINNIRNNYLSQYKDRLKEEHAKVVDIVTYKRSQADLLVEGEIRDKVQSAYTIASHTYRLYKDNNSHEELQEMVTEILRPIRWNNNKGYYFSGNLDTQTIELYADEPWFEGKNASKIQETTRSRFVSEICNTIQNKGAGIHHFTIVKPKFGNTEYAQTAFVKYFAPFNWFIGAAIYTKTTEEHLQRESIKNIQSMHFGKDGEIFGFRIDGTIIIHPDTRLIGRSIDTLVDDKQGRFGKKMLSTALSDQGEGFIQHLSPKGNTQKHQKLSYIRLYPEWGWAFGTTLSMEEMKKAINYETETYRQIAFKNVSMFIMMFIIAVFFLLLFSYIYSLKIKQGITLFTDFFRKAAISNEKITAQNLGFLEFENLSELANQMVDDRIHKELLLKRDELRLDTLLSLGSMDKKSIQEKYDFILQAIIRITRSETGYLALVNTAQSHISISSYAQSENILQKSPALANSRPVLVGGLPGAAVLHNKHIICNNFKEDGFSTFPYTCKVKRHIDVPISMDGKIVLVAGVCNNRNQYDTNDIKQVKMLLEGMWMHILKTRSEKEMERLERQVIAVGEKERNAIGRDLHDDLGSHLTGVELLSKVLHQQLEKEDAEKANQLNTIRDLIRDAIEKTRRLAQGLYPAHVIEHGLEAAVDQLTVEVNNLFHANCNYSLDGNNSWMDNNVVSHVYYIIREAVFNGARHGKATNIDIILRSNRAGFTLQIGDDGTGFDQKLIRKGLGCTTMQYRAKAIGCSLEIISYPQQGTTVMLTGAVREYND